MSGFLIAMKFEDYNIDERIKKGISDVGFKRPTDIQFKAIRHILAGEDVMAIAQTGTGKTAAFVIPVLDKILKTKNRKGISCLVMVPTRELADQIKDSFESLGKETKLRFLSLMGGVDQESQKKSLKDGVDVLITTPGRMFDLINQSAVNLSKVSTLVLDEADLMLDMGFYKDIEDVKRHLPRYHQTLFFSATISKKIKKMAYKVVRDAIRIQISPFNPVSKNVDHSVVFVEMDDKRFFLEATIKEFADSKMLVFARTQVRVERIVKAMERVGIDAEGLHGGLEQNDRFDILERFRSGENDILITTDVAARGIDIPNVDYVVNYDLPENPENYVHRCGRTGRGKNYGQAVSFCSEGEMELLSVIEEYTGSDVERYELSKKEYAEILKETNEDESDWQTLIDRTNQEDGTEDTWK
jgi:ATP-dependent RNA helicase RhlE